VQPGSPTEGRLQPGDILVRVNGRLVTTFEPLAEVLDSSVGQAITLQVERGGEVLERRLEVGDLHAITPAEYLEFGDAVVHALSYQMARHFNAPVQGVFVANPGYALGAAGVPRGAAISSVGGKAVRTLADFEQSIAGLADGARAPLRYATLDDPQGTQTKVMRMDRRWFPARHCRRDDATGYWPCRELAAAPPAPVLAPARTTFVATGEALADRLAPSLVLVNFDMPFSVAGVTERNYHGTGLLVDDAAGLVAVDRNTVPVAVGDVRLTFAGSIEVPGRIEYVHPVHNLAIVSFDPALLDGTPIRAIPGCARSPRRLRRSKTSVSRCRARCSSAKRT
jgi:S1-C subfamily serine protease